MDVTWNARALRRHRQQERVGRVKAKVSGMPVGDIRIGVPVVTDHQLRRLEELAATFKMLRDDLSEQLEVLEGGLDCLRGANHPDGWAEVEVAERAKNVLVATVRHHKAALTGKKVHTDTRLFRAFHGGYQARRR